MSDPLRVVYFHQSSELYGSDKVLLSLVSNLDRSKFIPIVLLPSEGPLTSAIIEAGIECKVVSLVQVNRATLSILGLMLLPIEIYRSVKSIDLALAGVKVDIVHSNTLAVLSGAIWAKLKRIKHVWHVHEIIERPVIVRKTFAWLLHLFSHKVVCNSKATMNNLLRDAPVLSKKTTVVWNGMERPDLVNSESINSIRRQLALNTEDVLVVLVGRINRWKGHGVLVDAANILYLRGVKNIKFCIVGGPPTGQEDFLTNLENQIECSHVKSNITIMPFKKDIWSIWGACDIAVVPSIEPEPFGMVALEAMSVGKSVIAANHGGLSEIVINGKTGILVKPGDPKELADAIETLSKSDTLRNKMGESGFSRLVDSFSLTQYVSAMSTIYEEVNDFK